MKNLRAQGEIFIKIMDRVNNALILLCGLLFAIMVVVVFFAIIIRFLLSGLGIYMAAPWTEEVARYLLIWAAFLAGGVGARTGELIGLDVLVDHLPGTIGIPAKYICHVLSIIFYVALVIIGYQWTEFGMEDFSPVMEIPKSTINAAMVAGGVVMILNTIALIISANLKGADIRRPFAQPPSQPVGDSAAGHAEGDAR